MLIRKDKYPFDPQMKEGGVYWEYGVNLEFLFILKYACRDTEEGTKVANQTGKLMKEMPHEAFSPSSSWEDWRIIHYKYFYVLILK